MRKFFKWIDKFYWGSGIADDIPALTYFLLISLLPFSLGLVVTASIVFGDNLSPQALVDNAGNILPKETREFISNAVLSAKSNSPWLLVFSLFAMAWTASGAIGVIERCSARINNSRRYTAVWGKIRNIGFGFLIAFFIVGGTAASVVVSGAADQLELGGFWTKAIPLLHLLASILLCTFIFRYVTKDNLAWKRALYGGVFSGTLLQISPFLVSIYIKNISPSLENFFITLAALILVCYLLSICFLFGVGIAGQAWNVSETEKWLSDEFNKQIDNSNRQTREWKKVIQWRVQNVFANLCITNPKNQPIKQGVLFSAKQNNKNIFVLFSPKTIEIWPEHSCLPKITWIEKDFIIYENHSHGYTNYNIEKDTLDSVLAKKLIDNLRDLRTIKTPALPLYGNLWKSLYKENSNTPENLTQYIERKNVWVPGNNIFSFEDCCMFIKPEPRYAPIGLLEAQIISRQEKALQQELLEYCNEANLWINVLEKLDLSTNKF